MAGIWVIGGANLDVMATSFKPLVKADSNPGKVTYSVGGVAHNVACNLAKMGCEVRFISAFSGDAFSEIVRQECLDNHIDLTYSQQFDDYSTSLYLALAEPDGEMSIAIADMDILSHLDMNKVVPLLQQMQEDDLVFIDTNLTEQQLAQIVDNCRGRLFCDPISTAKAVRIKPFLSQLEMLKPNLLEARTLLEAEEMNHEELLNGFLQQQLKTIVISMGPDGVIGSNGTDSYHLANVPVDIINTTGAGDSFMAGFMYGQYRGHGFLESMQLALAASSITLTSLKTVSDEMSADNLMKQFERIRTEGCVNRI